MYISPSQFSEVKGEKPSLKFLHYWNFYRKNSLITNLQVLSVIFSLFSMITYVVICEKYKLLDVQAPANDFIILGCYVFGVVIWCALYLLILNKIEYPRYKKYIAKNRNENDQFEK